MERVDYDMKTIRIGCGQGFWGDAPDAPLRLVNDGPLDYLILDYLAEVTMSVLVRQQQKHPEAGYARDFVRLVEQLAPHLAAKGVRLLANAGGVNPEGCARAVYAALQRLGLHEQLTVAVVTGDNILDQLDTLQQQGEQFSHFEDGRELGAVRSSLVSANVYLGAEPMVEALRGGASIVITGRVADPSLALAPMIAEFGWDSLNDDAGRWDLFASGVVAGHVIECGAQATGGNFLGGWQQVPNLAAIGYPIAEVSADGSVVITKHSGSGGLVSCATVAEQLVYEIGDPARYVTPDAVADFTSLRLSSDGEHRVAITGVRGAPRPEKLKVSMSYASGYTAAGTMLYSWPDAAKKVRAAGELVRERLRRARVAPERLHIECIGADACHGRLSGEPGAALAEAMLRVAVWSADKHVAERCMREIPPLVLNGPPGATAYFGSKGEVREVFAYWPALVSRAAIPVTVQQIR